MVTKGTNDLQYNNQYILKDTKAKRENVSSRRFTTKRPMIWSCKLGMYKISDKVISFILEALKIESGINSKRKNFCRGENSERHLTGLVSSFNGISNSTGYLRPKPFIRRTVVVQFPLKLAEWIRELILFPRVLVQKWTQ